MGGKLQEEDKPVKDSDQGMIAMKTKPLSRNFGFCCMNSDKNRNKEKILRQNTFVGPKAFHPSFDMTNL